MKDENGNQVFPPSAFILHPSEMARYKVILAYDRSPWQMIRHVWLHLANKG